MEIGLTKSQLTRQIASLMLQTKKPLHQFNQTSHTYKNQSNSNSFHFKRSDSRIIQQPPQFSLNLNIQHGQSFICYQCANGPESQQCKQCEGTGFIKANHPLVTLMNEIFNTKLTSPQTNENKKQLISTKSESNSNISDSLCHSELLTSSQHKNALIDKKKSPENQRCSILEYLLTPLQTIIKEESTVEDKCQKCNICHYEFDGAKYNCSECENYNVCEQCYLTKRIGHCHELKKIQSVSSQKTGKQQESEPQQSYDMGISRNHNDQVQNTHSDVDKLSLRSDESVELMFKGLETKRQPTLCKQRNNGCSFFQLHEIQVNDSQNQDTNMKVKNCQNCNQMIDDCHWICQTCPTQGQSYHICKSCYDSDIYDHPRDHNLGLNFFNFDQNFLESEHDFLDYIKEDTTKELESNLQSKVQKDGPISSLSLNSNSQNSQKKDPNMLNIGVIGHRDIFTGFHKQTVNDRYPEQIISPIPRSMALTHSFKEKKSSPESESDFITDLIKSPSPAYMGTKNYLEPQKEVVKTFNDQSRVEFDDNLITELSLSRDQNYQSNKTLFSSQRKANRKPDEGNIRDSGSMFQSTSQINPETSILEMNQGDFEFVDYYCDICATNPIKNVKFHCLECQNYDLCSDCYENKRLQHWHDHFRKDDGRMKARKLKENKEKLMKRTMENSMNRSISPSRRSIRFMK